ncbi:MAG: DUF4190 domain-containing protein [Ezakiella sp.]|nr:DUF4190 domain-containing protein [Ezakiella sp.]MDD7761668.1 DUF4190 domain-containing protein [Bacillota bacterium]MDY3947497.1 DUF4190 domain-containing protein [Ezakiella sp.]
MNRDNYGFISLILGMIAIVLGLTQGLSVVGVVSGIVGVYLALEARKDDPSNSLAKYGLITSIIGLVLSVIFLIACISCVSCIGMSIMSI